MDYGYFPLFKKKKKEGNGAGELSVFCQSYFNKTLIGQAGSIGRSSQTGSRGGAKRLGVFWDTGSPQPLLRRSLKRQHVTCPAEKGMEPLWLT